MQRLLGRTAQSGAVALGAVRPMQRIPLKSRSSHRGACTSPGSCSAAARCCSACSWSSAIAGGRPVYEPLVAPIAHQRRGSEPSSSPPSGARATLNLIRPDAEELWWSVRTR